VEILVATSPGAYLEEALLVVAVALALLIMISHYGGDIEGFWLEFLSWGMILLGLALIVLTLVVIFR